MGAARVLNPAQLVFSLPVIPRSRTARPIVQRSPLPYVITMRALLRVLHAVLAVINVAAEISSATDGQANLDNNRTLHATNTSHGSGAIIMAPFVSSFATLRIKNAVASSYIRSLSMQTNAAVGPPYDSRGRGCCTGGYKDEER